MVQQYHDAGGVSGLEALAGFKKGIDFAVARAPPYNVPWLRKLLELVKKNVGVKRDA